MLEHANQVFQPAASFLGYRFERDARSARQQSDLRAGVPMQLIPNFFGNHNLALARQGDGGDGHGNLLM